MLKIVGEVERFVDLVVNICKVVWWIYGYDLDFKLRGIIYCMSDQV